MRVPNVIGAEHVSYQNVPIVGFQQRPFVDSNASTVSVSSASARIFHAPLVNIVVVEQFRHIVAYRCVARAPCSSLSCLTTFLQMTRSLINPTW